MFGNLLSAVINVATLPVDVANAGVDIVTGGDGGKESRNHPDNCSPFALVEKIRDAASEAARDIDRD